jgi:microcystin-dependent protein
MSQFYVGEIILVAFNFAPPGWMPCEGQLLPISEYETLFNLIGTTYGGDGQSTFALPDLRSRIPVHFGQGSGLTFRQIGETSGSEAVTLLGVNLPAHTHAIDQAVLAPRVHCQTLAGTARTAVNNVPAREAAGVTYPYSSQPADTDMRAGTVTVTGSPGLISAGAGVAHTNIQPVLAMTYLISLFGIFPPSS